MLWVHSLTPTCLLCWSCLFAVDLGEASVYSIISNNIIGLLKCPVDVSNSRYSRQFAIKAPINLNTAALSQVNNAAWHSWAFKTVRAARRRRQSACVSEIFRSERFFAWMFIVSAQNSDVICDGRRLSFGWHHINRGHFGCSHASPAMCYLLCVISALNFLVAAFKFPSMWWIYTVLKGIKSKWHETKPDRVTVLR